MTIIGIFLSFIMGWGIVRQLTPHDKAGSLEDLFLAWGVGAICASQITFYSLLPFGRLIPPLTCALGLLCAGTLWLFLARTPQKNILKIENTPHIFLVGFLLFCAILFLYQAIVLPYGGYDAWSLWNYRAASVFRGGDHWSGIFHNEIQGKHPWLLPFFVVWGWCFSGGETTGVPILIALLTALATMGLLVHALAEDIGGGKALLGGIFLFFLPFFAWHSVSQYASILVAYYMLAACLCLKKAASGQGQKYWILSAVFLGALAFSKDEGLVLAATTLASFFIFLKPRGIDIGRNFWLVLGGISLATALTEIFMRTAILSSAPYISSNLYIINLNGVFNGDRWTTIGSFFWNKIILHAEFGRLHLWLPLTLLGLFTPVGRFILGSVLTYSAVFFFLYLVVAHDLVWRIDVTADRLLFLVMPIMVYLVFYSLFLKKRRTP
jgi:hypothetical protein